MPRRRLKGNIVDPDVAAILRVYCFGKPESLADTDELRGFAVDTIKKALSGALVLPAICEAMTTLAYRLRLCDHRGVVRDAEFVVTDRQEYCKILDEFVADPMNLLRIMTVVGFHKEHRNCLL
jgi:hypothetical protein